MKKILRKYLRKDSSKSQSREFVPATESQQHGLQLVYESENPSIDIVAIHGHGGHWKNSWIYTREEGADIFWLHDFLPNILPPARILSFGYDASDPLGVLVEGISSNFLSSIIRIRSETRSESRPLIFIAHSFGGMILKGALGVCEGMYPEFRSSVYGIIFLGVPPDAKGSLGNQGVAMLGTDDLSDTPLISALKRDIRWLHDQIGRYDQICDEFVVKYFLESDGTSATSRLPPTDIQKEQLIPLNRTHGMMARYASADDDDFEKIAKCLVNMVEQLRD